MKGTKLKKLVERYREQRDDAYGEGDDFPSLEAAFTLEARKQIKKKFGEVVDGMIDDLEPLIDDANNALSALDNSLATIEFVANLLIAAEKGDEIVDLHENPEPREVPFTEVPENDGGHKIKDQ